MAVSRTLITRKKRVTPVAPRVRKGAKIQGPSFTGWETWTGEQYHIAQRDAKDFYYQNYKPADLLADAWAWMKENKYSVGDIRSAKAHGVTVSVSILCKLLRIGMPDYNPVFAEYWEGLAGTAGKVEPHSVFIRKQLAKSIQRGKSIVEEEKKEEAKVLIKPYIPSIQERLREVAYAMTDEIETIIDEYIQNPDSFDPKNVKVAAILRGNNAKAAHARIIKNHYQRILNEYTELLSANCDKQLWEGYSIYGKKNIKKMFDFLTTIIATCDQIAGEAKVMRKPRAKKAKPAEELVKKIKFKPTDDRYNIASIPPSQIIGATTVAVFNTKTRKLGVYQSENEQGFGVKGASITNFKIASQQKTLRKPEQQLKEFKDVNTSKRMQVWFNGIKTTSTVLTGRINGDVMILKAWK